MSFDGSEQSGRALQYLYRIKQEHKHIVERLDTASAAQTVTNETLQKLLARMTKMEQQPVQFSDQSRKAFLTTCAELSEGIEETKAHIERQCRRTKVLETNDHEKDDRLNTFLSMIQDISKRLDQQEKSTTLLLISRGKLTKKKDSQDLESQVVTLETENRDMRRELDTMRRQSGQLTMDFKTLQKELIELKQQRPDDLTMKSGQSNATPTVLVPMSQPEESQDQDVTQSEHSSSQETQTRKRCRPTAKAKASTQHVKASQPTQLLGHVYVRRSPRNHPESQASTESRRATRVSSQVASRARGRSPEKKPIELQSQTIHLAQDQNLEPLPDDRLIEAQSRQKEPPKQKAMSLTQHPSTGNLVFHYSDTQRARELIESIFARSDPARPSADIPNDNSLSNHLTRPVTTKKAHSSAAGTSMSSPRKRKSSAAANPERGEAPGDPDGKGVNMVQDYPRLEKRRNVETRRSTQMEPQKRRQVQQPDHKTEPRAAINPSVSSPGDDPGSKQTGRQPKAPTIRRKKRFLPIYELPLLQEW